MRGTGTRGRAGRRGSTLFPIFFVLDLPSFESWGLCLWQFCASKVKRIDSVDLVCLCA